MINKLLIRETASIKESMKQLDKAAMGVLFVVDKDHSLIGALTDGDIRRAILDGKDIMEAIQGVYNSNPYFVYENYDENEVKHIFVQKRIEVIPIVNKEKQIQSYLNWERFFGEKAPVSKVELNLPVVIMAGGKGTRMAPFTNILPKPLIPIGEKTIMELIIEEFLPYNIKDFYFTLNYKGKMIEAYFNSIERDYNIKNVWEDKFEGTAGSLKLLPLESIKDDFILSNCDVIVKADYAKALEHHRESNALVTVLSSIQHYKIPYGVIEFEKNGEVLGLIEKPEYTFSINTGVYIVNKKAIDFIPEDTVFHMTHLMELLIEKKQKVLTYPVNEKDYIDIGQWEEYKQTISKLSFT